jgi:hypothetical protein
LRSLFAGRSSFLVNKWWLLNGAKLPLSLLFRFRFSIDNQPCFRSINFNHFRHHSIHVSIWTLEFGEVSAMGIIYVIAAVFLKVGVLWHLVGILI